MNKCVQKTESRIILIQAFSMKTKPESIMCDKKKIYERALK